MKITIEIPKEFEKDFNEDRFGNYFGRVLADTLYHPMSDCSNLNLCGNYENETTRMFIKAFHNAEVQKICSNGQSCKHPNCPKCGTTHSMSECNYTRVKEKNDDEQ